MIILAYRNAIPAGPNILRLLRYPSTNLSPSARKRRGGILKALLTNEPSEKKTTI